MADKLIRTAVVMSFFLILALFSSCGANGNSITDAHNSIQTTVKSGEVMLPIGELLSNSG